MALTKSVSEIIEGDSSGLLAIHPSWERVPLAAVGRVLNGFPFDSAQFSNSEGTPLVRIRDVVSGETKTFYTGAFDSAYVVRAGDLLVGMDGDFNTARWRNADALLNQRVCKVEIDARFYVPGLLDRVLPAYLGAIHAETSSVTVKHLSSRTVEDIRLPLPPLAEQHRLTEKLDELFTELDAGVAELLAAQKKLAQYRKSLLKAAMEGALTADWRAANPLQESGEALLARILRERRARWEAWQLDKFKAHDKTPPKDWQKKYPEPRQPDTSEMPLLPQGWVYASLDQLLLQLRSGSSETSIREVTAFPVLKSSAVRPRLIDFSALNYLTSAQSRTENRLELGDLLISRLSGSVEYVGCCAQVNELPLHGVQYPDRLFCGKLVAHSETVGSHIVICMSSPHARAKIEKAAKSTAGHKRISLSDLHPFAIALQPLLEAQELVCVVETSLSAIARQELAIQLALNQSTAQRQNILRAAFTGQLVPQDPADEPASVLLARIRTERDSQVANKKPAKRMPDQRKKEPS